MVQNSTSGIRTGSGQRVHVQERIITSTHTLRPAGTRDADRASPAVPRPRRPSPAPPARPVRAGLAVAPGVVVSLALGAWGIGREGRMWRDEAVTYEVVHRQLPDLWQLLANADAVHGLYYLIVHGLFALCGSLFGAAVDPLLVLRLPSVLATAAATAGVVLVGRLLGRPRAALLAGLAFALLPPVQRYAQEGRSYALVCALVVWATYVLLRTVARPDRALRSWAGYAALLLAAALLHEFAVLVLPAHLTVVPRVARRRWACAAAGVLAGVAPLAWVSNGQSEQVSWLATSGVTPETAVLFAVGVLCAACLAGSGAASRATTAAAARWPFARRAAARRHPVGVDAAGGTGVRRVGAGRVGAGRVGAGRVGAGPEGPQRARWTTPRGVRGRSGSVGRVAPALRWAAVRPAPALRGPARRAVVLPFALLLLPVLVLLLVSAVKPLYMDRYVLYGNAGLALLVGAALDRALRAGGRRAATAGAAALVVVVSLLPLSVHLRTPESRLDDATSVAQAVAATATEGDGVVYLPARRRAWLLPYPRTAGGLRDVALDRGPLASATLYGTELAPDALRARMLARPRIIAVSDPPDEPRDPDPREAVKREVLRDHFERCGTLAVHGAQVSIWARPGRC
ncbi:hypothetical protein [Streptomyces sp. NPDC060194]|uniref:hypothetical protein n=1 Tax=Streptomyces sp. NPDC060194 TaxID=3347069 RepID=UPI003656371D